MKCKCGEIVDHAAYARYKAEGKAIAEQVNLEVKGPKQPKHKCDCGAEFDGKNEFIKHRLDCTAKVA